MKKYIFQPICIRNVCNKNLLGVIHNTRLAWEQNLMIAISLLPVELLVCPSSNGFCSKFTDIASYTQQHDTN